jgi:hypothetical protein
MRPIAHLNLAACGWTTSKPGSFDRNRRSHFFHSSGSATTSCPPSTLFSCAGNEIRFDPVSIGLRHLSNGVKESSHRRPLPPCERSPVPEPCFYPGTKQQRESALACRPESRSDLQQPGAVDERLAPVTVSKARPTAFKGHLAWLDWLDTRS